MIARLSLALGLATLLHAAPALAGAIHGPDVTGELEKFLPLEIGAADCWTANVTDGPVSDVRFTLLVQGPGAWDEPGIFRYHYEMEATDGPTGVRSSTSNICLSSDDGIRCETECESGGIAVQRQNDGSIRLTAEDLQLRSCGDDRSGPRLAGTYDLLQTDDCPVFVPRDPEAGID